GSEVPAGAKGSADAGQKIFNTIGCKGCHVNLNDPVEKRGNKTVTLGEQWIITDLTKSGKATADEARKLYDQMTYNERQLYVLENLEQLPGATDRPSYPDGSPKPIFMHHGPELSGIGTKLTAGRTPEEARAWLFNWVKDPRHYSDYTLMPNLRLTDQQALDLTEYLITQTREKNKPGDEWTAAVTPEDP